MLCFPNAKINVGLNIVEKRTDGFHNIETVFYPVPFCDVLEITQGKKSPQISLTISGINIKGTKDDNLCIRAFRLLQKEFDLPPVHMHLHKMIPAGAGLGGGSSDAAFTLKLLNGLFDLKLDDTKLRNFAVVLGSDCAFFIENTPCLATGRGEQLESVSHFLHGYSIVIVIPPVHISTTEAYSEVRLHKSGNTLEEISILNIKTWKETVVNQFEETIFRKHPSLAKIKQHLYDLGAVYASMSGSGSAIYGIFTELPNMKKLFGNCFVWKGKL